MKNYILLIPFIIGFFIAGCSTRETVKKEETTTKKEEIKVETPVKKIPTVEMRERELVKKLKIRNVERIKFVYDKSGKLIRDGKISNIEYNKNGLSTKSVFYDDKEKVKNTFTYKYDKDGNRVETQQIDKDNKMQDRFTYEYAKDGRKIRSFRYNEQGVKVNYYEYDYNDKNNLIEERWYDASGKEEFTIEYDYENGKKTEAVTYDDKGKEISRYEFKYDDKGNIVEEIQYEGGNQISLIQYVYKY